MISCFVTVFSSPRAPAVKHPSTQRVSETGEVDGEVHIIRLFRNVSCVFPRHSLQHRHNKPHQTPRYRQSVSLFSFNESHFLIP